MRHSCIPENTRRLANVGTVLGQRRGRWANIVLTLAERLVLAGMRLLGCFNTCEVSRYCLSALHSSIVPDAVVVTKTMHNKMVDLRIPSYKCV